MIKCSHVNLMVDKQANKHDDEVNMQRKVHRMEGIDGVVQNKVPPPLEM